jgi:4,5-DOPA dioxygenase extradiol
VTSSDELDFSQYHSGQRGMPVLFVGHGSPMNALEDNAFTRDWRTLGSLIPSPVAILSVSAHWLTRGTFVTGMPQPRTIHDFGGFPPELYAVEYPAPGDPDLAESIASLIKGTTVTLDQSWGLDHGTWVVLTRMYPDAEIPVLQLSIDLTQPPASHFTLGQQLAPLRRQGVLILGSGNIVHNLRLANPAVDVYPWAREFDEKIAAALLGSDPGAIVDYEGLGESAHLSVPTNDHYLPLLYAVGARHADDRVAFYSEHIVFGSISMRCVLFF